MRPTDFFLADISTEYNIDSSARTAEIIYTINENKSFNYNHIAFYGLDNISASLKENIKSNFDINYSDKYTESEVALKITQAISTLKDSGYMDATFDSTVINIDTAKSTTSIGIFFDSGSRYKLSEINIVKTGIGKDEVNDEVIKNLTAFEKKNILICRKFRKGRVVYIAPKFLTRHLLKQTLRYFRQLCAFADKGGYWRNE